MKIEEISKLIDRDIDEAFVILDKIFIGDSQYTGLNNEYIDRPGNFQSGDFRSRLKRFVINYKTKISEYFIKKEKDEVASNEELEHILLDFNFQTQSKCIEKVKNKKGIHLFTFDKNSKEEADFIYNKIKHTLAPKHECYTISVKHKTNLKDVLLQNSGFTNVQPVLICVNIATKKSDYLTQIIDFFNTNPIALGDYPLIVFLIPRYRQFSHSKCTKIPYSALQICENAEKKLIEHLNKMKVELTTWVENKQEQLISIAKIEKCHCEEFHSEYTSDFVDFQSYVDEAEKKYTYYFLKEFTQKYLRHEISFDKKLNLKLIPCETENQ